MLANLTIAEAAEQIRKRALSPVELTQACLERIERLNPTLNAFLTVTADDALESARLAEEALLKGEYKGPLHGIPIALKDLFDMKGVPTTAGSPILSNYVPSQDAAVVMRLREAKAVLLGKTALHEWALGVTNNNPHFGPTHNPWDLERIPGGSSGGSAAALAAGLCLGALGSDTGGSIRIPAALCGVVGLKPTYGRLSLRGIIPLSWSLDHAGPMAKTVKDTAILLQALAGYDSGDPTSVNTPVDDYLAGLENGIKGTHVLVPQNFFFNDIDAEVAGLVRAAISELEHLGAKVIEVVIEGIDEAVLAHMTILLADAAAYHEEHLQTRADDIGSDVRARLQRGQMMTALDYARARREQTRWRRYLEDLLKGSAVLAVPTTPIPAPLIAEVDALEAARVLTRLTAPFNLAGVPAISVSCGFTQGGLPVGLQLIGSPWHESTVLRVAYAYEQATVWYQRKPSLRFITT